MLSGDEVEPISSATSPFKVCIPPLNYHSLSILYMHIYHNLYMQVIFDPNKTRPHYLFVWKDVSTNVNNMNVMDIPPADLTRYLLKHSK